MGGAVRWVRQAAGAAAILVGLGILVGEATAFSPGRAGKGDRLISLVEGELTDKGLAEHQFDLSTWDGASAQLQTETIPFLAARAGVDRQTFITRLRHDVPEVDAAVTTLPGALPFAHKILDNLAHQQENFQAAQDLPGPGLSLRAGWWLMLLTGLLVVALGLAVMLVDSVVPAVALVAVGAVLVAGPVAVGFNAKADKASDLLATLNFDREVAAKTRRFFEVTRDVLASVDTKIIPFTARIGNLDEAALMTETHQKFAHVTTALDHQTEIARRFEARVRIREAAVDSLNEVKKAPLRSLGWMTIAAGVVVLAAGFVAIASGRRKIRPGNDEALAG